MRFKRYLIERLVPIDKKVLDRIYKEIEQTYAGDILAKNTRTSLTKKDYDKIAKMFKAKPAELKKPKVIFEHDYPAKGVLLGVGLYPDVAQDGVAAKFNHEKNVIYVYMPWQLRGKLGVDYDWKEVDLLIANIKDGVRHEMVHFIQYNTPERIGLAKGAKLTGKEVERAYDPTKAPKEYYLDPVEYKPLLQSSVRDFERQLEMLKYIKKPITRLALQQFIGEKITSMVYSEGGNVSSARFFVALKQYDKTRWKKAVKDFILLLKKDSRMKQYLKGLGI